MSYGMTLLKKIAASPQLDLRTVSVLIHPRLDVLAITVILKDWDKLGWVFNDPSAHVPSKTTTKGE
jgi:hypothetical protein